MKIETSKLSKVSKAELIKVIFYPENQTEYTREELEKIKDEYYNRAVDEWLDKHMD